MQGDDFFEPGSAEMSADGKSALADVVSCLREGASWMIEVNA